MHQRLGKSPITFVAVVAAYFAIGRLCLALGAADQASTALWAPSGFAVATLIILGRYLWPAIFAGSFLVYVTATGYVGPSVVMSVGNTAEAVIAALLVERLASGTQAFRHAQNTFRFAMIVAVCSTPIGALFGVATATMNGVVSLDMLAYVWMTHWLADLTGALVVTPFFILWATSPVDRGRWFEMLEAFVLLLMLVGVGMLVFVGKFPGEVKNYPLEFLCFPFLLWAAFRFGRREVITAIVIMAGLAVWGTLHGLGPFARETANEALVLLQAYTCVMAIMGTALAAVVAEHRRAEMQLHELAITDPLTGLANYRRLLEVLKTEIARSGRTSRPFAVLFVDMNGLKKINDKYGHLVGSRALCRIAETLRRSVRTIDTPARYGGDEFAVVLPETPEAGAQIVLKRVFDRLAADPDKPAVSVSGGVAVYPRDGESPTQLLRAADRLLYESKAQLAAARKKATTDDDRKTGTLF